MGRGHILGLMFLLSVCAPAEVIDLRRLTPPEADDYASFKYGPPNETDPKAVVPFLNNLAKHFREEPSRLAVSVGSERGFIHASLSDAITHLVQVDIDPEITQFNRLNAKLLAMAADRADYVALRRTATLADWMARLPRKPRAGSKSAREWSNAFDWWRINVRDNVKFVRFNSPPFAGGPFEEANYLYDEVQFGRLQRMAREGRIQAETIDLTNAKSVDQLAGAVRKSGHRLVLADVSNAWWPLYVGPAKTAELVAKLRPLGTDRSILLMSSPLSDQWSPDRTWGYLGISFGRLAERGEKVELAGIAQQSQGRNNSYFFSPLYASTLDRMPIFPAGSCVIPLLKLPTNRDAGARQYLVSP